MTPSSKLPSLIDDGLLAGTAGAKGATVRASASFHALL